MIAGRDAARHGEAKNSWLTGTAAWTFVNLSQAILGVQPSYDGLSIDPCIPEASVTSPSPAASAVPPITSTLRIRIMWKRV